MDIDHALFSAEALHVTRSHGRFRVLVTARDVDSRVAREHLALVRGSVAGCDRVLCHVSSACVMSTVFDSATCGCAARLDGAFERIARAGRGVLVHLVDQQGGGFGLTHRLEALGGVVGVAADDALCGATSAGRDGAVVAILSALDVRSVVLLGGTADARRRLAEAGVAVDGVERLRAPDLALPT